jgi:hypothetical protein
VQRIERQLRDFVQGQVRDAFAGVGVTLQSIPRQDIDRVVDTIYEQAFEAIQIPGEGS